ncbi:Serine/arginine-rich splicing factor SR45a [Camellia lanceoleosa]|uniref:Serine/arginine-rich splicing factor SR45a n=1 Tax=Camellia lanceoleosa TaxID=1840588 RepID=A0ACC0IBJ3_9ERIC|nr:Serine/arginine-rich splicing factor SR45a [Camellia lanceoleosa]
MLVCTLHFDKLRYSRSPSPCAAQSRSRSRSRSTSRSWSRPRGRSRSRSRSRGCGRTDVGNPGNTLYVTGLSIRVTERELEDHFSKEGKVGLFGWLMGEQNPPSMEEFSI